MLRSYVGRVRRWFRYLWRYFASLKESNEIVRKTDFAAIQKPVLLLYGFGATRRSVAILEERLRKEEFDVFTLRLGGFLDTFNTGAIDTLGNHVAQKIESLYQRYPLPKMAIIGVSKGGLIGRYYVSCLGGNVRVHTLMTLATPHQGNPWMLFFIPVLLGLFARGIRQMYPGSRFLRRLAKKPIPSEVYTVSLFSPADKVCPPRYCRLPEQKHVTNIEIDGIRHAEFVIKRRAFDIILRELKRGWSRYSPYVC